MVRRSPLLVTAVAVLALVLTAAPATAQPSVTVTPDSGLTDGQTVQVHATGYTPNSNRWIAQCKPDSASQDDCGDAQFFVTDSNGELNESWVVTQIVADYDCVEGGCAIWVFEIPPVDPFEWAFAEIAFAQPDDPTEEDDDTTAPGDSTDDEDDAAAGDTDGEEAAATDEGETPRTGLNLLSYLLVIVALLVAAAGAYAFGRRRPGLG